jgi:hypothetical protein
MRNLISNFRYGVSATLIMCILLTCSKNEVSVKKPVGTLKIDLGVSVASYDVYNHLKAANPEEFVVNIYNTSDELIIGFNRAADIPEVIELPEGSYYAEAYSDNNIPAAFENDYYYGRSDNFDIIAAQTSTVVITCTLSNIMVTVIYSDNVMSSFDDYITTVSNAGGSLIFGPDETRPGYFDEGPLSINANLYYSDDAGEPQSKMLTGTIQNAIPGRHYQILIDATISDGEAIVDLVVDESYDTEVVVISEDESGSSAGNGDLLITEIMYNPAALSDTEGEWIEIYNNSASDYNLLNVIVVRASTGDRHTIGSDIILSQGSYAVIARTATATDHVDYVYGSSISLPNTGEELQLFTYGTNGTDGELICVVDYGAANFNTGLSGISVQLDPSISEVAQAMNGLNWCESTQTYSTGDLGSPGIQNTPCP